MKISAVASLITLATLSAQPAFADSVLRLQDSNQSFFSQKNYFEIVLRDDANAPDTITRIEKGTSALKFSGKISNLSFLKENIADGVISIVGKPNHTAIDFNGFFRGSAVTGFVATTNAGKLDCSASVWAQGVIVECK